LINVAGALKFSVINHNMLFILSVLFIVFSDTRKASDTILLQQGELHGQDAPVKRMEFVLKPFNLQLLRLIIQKEAIVFVDLQGI